MSSDPPEPAVLHVNDAKSWRGGEQQTLYLARGLTRRGIRTAVACRPGRPLAERAAAESVVVHPVPLRSEVDLLSAWRLARLVRREGYNILHAHTAHAHGLIWAARHIFRAPARVVAHRRIEFTVGRSLFGLGRLKYLRGVDAFIAISRRVRETLVEVGVDPARIAVVHSVTDTERFDSAEPDPGLRAELGLPEDAVVAGNIGYLVGHKDHANLIRATAIARRDVPALRTVIVGPGELETELKALADELGVRDAVLFTGFREDIPQLIRMFDFFALSSSEEGICSTLLDVMASGCPIVATRAGGVDEAVVDGETGLLVPIRDSGALAEGMVRLAREEALRERLARAGHERAMEHFTLDALVDGTLEAYRAVLGAGQGRSV